MVLTDAAILTALVMAGVVSTLLSVESKNGLLVRRQRHVPSISKSYPSTTMWRKGKVH